MNSKNGRKFYDLNIQNAIAFCEIRKGPEGIRSFCRSMNMLSPLAKQTI